MDTFIQKYRPQIKGSLSGWDRIVFRGFLRTLAYAHGMATYLQRIGCPLKDFGEFAQIKTEQLIAQSLLRAEQQNRPIEYIASPTLRKEDHARKIAKADNINERLIAILTCVEPCRSFEIYRNKIEKNSNSSPDSENVNFFITTKSIRSSASCTREFKLGFPSLFKSVSMVSVSNIHRKRTR